MLSIPAQTFHGVSSEPSLPSPVASQLLAILGLTFCYVYVYNFSIQKSVFYVYMCLFLSCVRSSKPITTSATAFIASLLPTSTLPTVSTTNDDKKQVSLVHLKR